MPTVSVFCLFCFFLPFVLSYPLFWSHLTSKMAPGLHCPPLSTPFLVILIQFQRCLIICWEEWTKIEWGSNHGPGVCRYYYFFTLLPNLFENYVLHFEWTSISFLFFSEMHWQLLDGSTDKFPHRAPLTLSCSQHDKPFCYRLQKHLFWHHFLTSLLLYLLHRNRSTMCSTVSQSHY